MSNLMDFLCAIAISAPRARRMRITSIDVTPIIEGGRSSMAEVVDIAIPATAIAVAELLGLTVSRSVTDGVRVRRIARTEAEIAIARLQDYGFVTRIIEVNLD
jgi:hypothetical protein